MNEFHIGATALSKKTVTHNDPQPSATLPKSLKKQFKSTTERQSLAASSESDDFAAIKHSYLVKAKL